MTQSSVSPHDVECAVSLATTEVDAGSEIIVTVSCACADGCELTDHTISIRDAVGTEVATGQLVAGDDADHAELSFRVSASAGEHSYTVALVAPDGIADAHVAEVQTVSVTTRAHKTFVNVWGLPPAAGVGEPLSFKVGVKCSCGCDMSGRMVEITGADGKPLATAEIGSALWPASAALHYIDITATAPAAAGRTALRVTVAASAAAPPHSAAAAEFSVNVVPAADHEITITVLDSDAGAPIANAQVVLHPYRAVTNVDGMARLRVARGDYRLQVSGKTYIAGLQDVSIAENLAISTELTRAPPPRSPDDGY